ncbi:hypothetical protein [Azobacteroides phage ProJPt-Bp1]|uniref:Uncharacterized protein n=1 Tax=Azobacteroides phage ProJPt-Bp1 TaxID=1920526 RepID=A0A1V1FG78_9CAUD|nr:hypothetical protein KNT10_gp15 [Azobacteroides phage ProJPt-Bp1]BAX03448.1 hypothetical protein [Azobacteroides phage ProJPt-Bp1]
MKKDPNMWTITFIVLVIASLFFMNIRCDDFYIDNPPNVIRIEKHKDYMGNHNDGSSRFQWWYNGYTEDECAPGRWFRNERNCKKIVVYMDDGRVLCTHNALDVEQGWLTRDDKFVHSQPKELGCCKCICIYAYKAHDINIIADEVQNWIEDLYLTRYYSNFFANRVYVKDDGHIKLMNKDEWLVLKWELKDKLIDMYWYNRK